MIFIQTLASASDELHPSDVKVYAKFSLNATLELLILYSALSIIIAAPLLLPNHGPDSDHILSWKIVLGYAFIKSYAYIYK